MNKKIKRNLGYFLILMLSVAVILLFVYTLNKNPKQLKVQNDIESKILEKLADKEFSFENPMVVQDPYGTNSLSAIIVFKSYGSSYINVTIKGKGGAEDYAYTMEKYSGDDEILSIPVVGLYANHLNIVEVAYGDQIKTFEIKTAKLPDNLFSTVVETSTPSLMHGGFTFVPRFGNSLAAFDSHGEVRFYSNYFHGRMVRELNNGNMLVYGPNAKTDLKKTLSRLYEIDSLGKIYNTYFVNDSIHHDYWELENGNLILTVDGNSTVKQIAAKVLSKIKINIELKKEQVLVEVGKNSKIVNTWDMEDVVGYMPNNNYDLEHDWFHLNAVIVDPKDDTFIVSSRHQNFLLKFSKDKNVSWIMGDHTNPNFTEEHKDLLLTPIGDDFEWQYGQHAPEIVKRDGDDLYLIVFDNGNMRSFDKNQYVLPKDNYSRVVLYKIDEKAMTIEQLFEYGKDRGSELFSSYVGDVDVLGKNHYLFSFTGVAYDADKNVTSKDYAECDTCGDYVFTGGSVIEYKDGEVIYEIKTNFKQNSGVMTYRAERLFLENSINNFKLD